MSKQLGVNILQKVIVFCSCKITYNVSLLELVAAYGKLFSITDRAKLGKRNEQRTEN